MTSNKTEYSFTEYKKRNVTFFKAVKHDNWDMKVYGINLDTIPNKNNMTHLLSKLPSPALTEIRYGLGFLIIHKGVVANWFLLNWWEQEDILHQKLFSSPIEDFGNINAVKEQSILACVHELEIYSFESSAWKEHILSQKIANFKGYLNATYQ